MGSMGGTHEPPYQIPCSIMACSHHLLVKSPPLTVRFWNNTVAPEKKFQWKCNNSVFTEINDTFLYQHVPKDESIINHGGKPHSDNGSLQPLTTRFSIKVEEKSSTFHKTLHMNYLTWVQEIERGQPGSVHISNLCQLSQWHGDSFEMVSGIMTVPKLNWLTYIS